MDVGKLFQFLKREFTFPVEPSPTVDKKGQYSIGGFEASAYTKDRSFIWYDNGANARNDTYSREELVRLTRYLVNNYPLFERVLSVTESYAVGGGIVANAATADDVFNDLATPYFNGWADNAFCSNNQQYNLYEMQRLMVRELLVAGEVFLVLIKTPSGYPQIMLVNTENVRSSGSDNDSSINGLYVDAYGKITAYNIFTGDTAFTKVDAANVIHIMRHKQIGQLRGLSAFAAALNAARDHKDIVILEKKAMKVHSMLAVQVAKNDGRGNTGTTGTMAPNPQMNASGVPIPQVNRGLEQAFAGNVFYTQKDEEIKLLASNRSTDGFIKLLEVLLREVCLTLSIPYEFLVNAEKLTGPAIRFIIGDAAFFFTSLQNMLLDAGLNRLYAWVIASAINDKLLPAPANNGLPWAVSWTTPIQITIDQQRVSNIEISLVQNSMLTLEGYYSARGKDWKQEVTQRAKEEQFLSQLAEETGVDINRLRTLQQGAAQIDAPKAEPDAS